MGILARGLRLLLGRTGSTDRNAVYSEPARNASVAEKWHGPWVAKNKSLGPASVRTCGNPAPVRRWQTKYMIRKIWLILAMIGAAVAIAAAPEAAPLRLIQTIPIPNVQGRIDHLDVDLAGHRLFMSALGNDTLEVFDLRENKLIHTVRGLHEPQGVTYVPKSNRIFVANGDDGTVRIFDASTFKLLKIVHFPSDADDTRYDAATNQVIVGYGDEGNAGLGILDGTTGNLLETIRLPSHPESFQLEKPAQRYLSISRQRARSSM